jgi:hypothetical protein
MDWKEIAHLLAERIACGCSQPHPCWTCQQALKRFKAALNEDARVRETIHRHPPDHSDR